MYCKVAGCRFPDFHVTNAHVCGGCGVTGHGLNECGSISLIDALASQDSPPIPLDMQCCVMGCEDVAGHTTAGHRCTHCKQHAHDATECPSFLWGMRQQLGTATGKSEWKFKEKKNVQIRARQELGRQEDKVYTRVYAGLGCWWFARRAGNTEKIKLMFKHSDDWGQYEEEEEARKTLAALEDFLEGHRLVK